MRVATFFAAALGALSFVKASPAPVEERGEIIGDIINAFGIGLVKDINTFLTLESLETDIVSVNFTISNPLPFELTIDRIVSDAGIEGVVYASFDYTFPKPGLRVPIFGSANSGLIPGVKLVQGALNSFDIIPLGYLDLIKTDAYVRGLTIKGKLGIPISILGLEQEGIPATYELVF